MQESDIATNKSNMCKKNENLKIWKNDNLDLQGMWFGNSRERKHLEKECQLATTNQLNIWEKEDAKKEHFKRGTFKNGVLKK